MSAEEEGYEGQQRQGEGEVCEQRRSVSRVRRVSRGRVRSVTRGSVRNVTRR